MTLITAILSRITDRADLEAAQQANRELTRQLSDIGEALDRAGIPQSITCDYITEPLSVCARTYRALAQRDEALGDAAELTTRVAELERELALREHMTDKLIDTRFVVHAKDEQLSAVHAALDSAGITRVDGETLAERVRRLVAERDEAQHVAGNRGCTSNALGRCILGADALMPIRNALGLPQDANLDDMTERARSRAAERDELDIFIEGMVQRITELEHEVNAAQEAHAAIAWIDHALHEAGGERQDDEDICDYCVRVLRDLARQVTEAGDKQLEAEQALRPFAQEYDAMMAYHDCEDWADLDEDSWAVSPEALRGAAMLVAANAADSQPQAEPSADEDAACTCIDVKVANPPFQAQMHCAVHGVFASADEDAARDAVGRGPEPWHDSPLPWHVPDDDDFVSDANGTMVLSTEDGSGAVADDPPLRRANARAIVHRMNAWGRLHDELDQLRGELNSAHAARDEAYAYLTRIGEALDETNVVGENGSRLIGDRVLALIAERRASESKVERGPEPASPLPWHCEPAGESDPGLVWSSADNCHGNGDFLLSADGVAAVYRVNNWDRLHDELAQLRGELEKRDELIVRMHSDVEVLDVERAEEESRVTKLEDDCRKLRAELAEAKAETERLRATVHGHEQSAHASESALRTWKKRAEGAEAELAATRQGATVVAVSEADAEVLRAWQRRYIYDFVADLRRDSREALARATIISATYPASAISKCAWWSRLSGHERGIRERARRLLVSDGLGAVCEVLDAAEAIGCAAKEQS